MTTKPIGIAVLGLGNVGSEVVRILTENAEDLAARVGAPLEIRGIAVRRVDGKRGVDAALLTDDPESLVNRDDVDIVVEVLGGIDVPRKLILAALEKGKSVVTANKALLAEYTGELNEAAEKSRADLYFEAAVAGAIPVVRPLMQSLAGDRVTKVAGIVNGTTNFILSAMDETGADYAETLVEAAAWVTQKPTRRPTSRVTTPHPRPRSSHPSRSIPVSPQGMCTARASATSPRRTWRRHVRSTARSNC